MVRMLGVAVACVALCAPGVVAAQSAGWARPRAESAPQAVRIKPSIADGPQAVSPGGLTNGSFESDLDDWTVEPGDCSWETLTEGEVTAAAGEYETPTALDGAHVLMSDAFNPGPCVLTQEVDVTEENRFFSAAVGYNYTDYGAGSDEECFGALIIADDEGQPISIYFQAEGGDDRPLRRRGQVDLGAHVGETVTIAAVTFSCERGPAGIMVDDVELGAVQVVPTLSEWAMILFGMLLAGGAALHLQRRRAA
jgi:hypothetical protein